MPKDDDNDDDYLIVAFFRSSMGYMRGGNSLNILDMYLWRELKFEIKIQKSLRETIKKQRCLERRRTWGTH